MKVYAIHINNLTTGMMCGSSIAQGCFNLIVDRLPAEAVYERHGRFLISNTDGVWRHFTIGEQGGFAGRTFKLRMKGGTVFKNKGYHYEEFKGNLWDTAAGLQKCMELAGGPLMSVSLRPDHENGCFIGGYYFSQEEILLKFSHLIRFASPTQNKAITFGE
ncbi:hypothetical protein [Vibrio phage XZ1]|uniref:Uncharacterized protein n=1 Tax=Vibrio phage phi-Grn1 TaxID=1747713 RepID=A0A126HGX8_9CAUD|nr:hypothetical protein phiGrn1_0361 [Vibrio phage phi-Grn1]UOL51277.1 hypothetical protein [Vibrio phage XZ1]